MSVNGNGLVALSTTPTDEPAEAAPPVTRSIHILVLDLDGELTDAVSAVAADLASGPEVTTCRHPRDLGPLMTEQRFDVLVAQSGLDHADDLERLRIIREELPNTALILVMGSDPETGARDLVRTGAIDLLDDPPPPDHLRDAVQRALQIAGRLHGRTDEQPEPAPLPSAEPRTPGRVLAVASASGGSGKTFLSTNLAWFLSAHANRRVCIIDLDLQFGEVAPSLQLKPRFALTDLLNHGGELGGDLSAHFVEFCEPWLGEVSILAAPGNPSAAAHVGPNDIGRVIEAARANFDDVIIDTPPALNDVFAAAISRSDEVLVLATLDIPSIRNMQVFLTSLEQMSAPADGVRLLLNKAEPDGGVDLRQLVKLFPQGFEATLPYAREVQRSINAGQPVLLTDPDAPISRQLSEGLARLLPPGAQEQFREHVTSARPSRFKRRKRQLPA